MRSGRVGSQCLYFTTTASLEPSRPTAKGLPHFVERSIGMAPAGQQEPRLFRMRGNAGASGPAYMDVRAAWAISAAGEARRDG